MFRFNRTASRILMGLALTLGLAAHANATPITGDPVGNDFGWSPNSTNEQNYNQEVPGRVGQVAPYVLFNSNAPGSVFLDFFNYGSGLAFFETRIDGIATGTTSHPVVDGDTIHSVGTTVKAGTELSREFFANSFVDIRLALGGERDYDFDWVRFNVEPASVPEPATFGLLGIGLAGMIAMRRRRN